MATDPRAVSTGLGQGEAQVFKPFETDYFKRKANLALEAKEKAQADVAAAISKTPWSRDMGQFKKMTQELKDYYTQNSRALLEGDFDAKVELMNKQQQLLDWYSQSKSAEKVYELTKNLYNNHPTKYTKESLDRLDKFASTEGLFDSSSLRLDPMFDKKAFLSEVSSAVGKMGYDLEDIRVVTLNDGTKMIQNKQGQDIQKLDDVINPLYSGAKNLYGEDQVSSMLGEQELLDYAEGFLNKKTGFSQKSDYWQSPSGQKKTQAAQRRKQWLYNVMNNVPGEVDKELGTLINKYNPALKGTLVSARVDTENFPTGMLVAEFTRDYIKDGKKMTQTFTKNIPLEGEGAYSELNSFASGFTGMENLDDNALSIAQNYEPVVKVNTPPPSGVSRSDQSLLEIMSTDGLGGLSLKDKDDLSKLQGLANKLSDEGAKSFLANKLNGKESVSNFITERLKGRETSKGKVDSVVLNPETLSKDEWIVMIGGKEYTLKSDDLSGIRYLLGMDVPADAASESNFIKELEGASSTEEKSVPSEEKKEESPKATKGRAY